MMASAGCWWHLAVLAGTFVVATAEVEDSRSCHIETQPAAGSALLQREKLLSVTDVHDRLPGSHKAKEGKNALSRTKSSKEAEPQSVFDWLWGSLDQTNRRTPNLANEQAKTESKTNLSKGVVTVKLHAMNRTPVSLVQQSRPSLITKRDMQLSTEEEHFGQSNRVQEQDQTRHSSKSWTGEAAPLDQDGYAAIAAKMDPSEMEAFVRRVCAKLELKVVDSKGLRELIPRYDGERETQNYGALEAELQRLQGQPDSWVEVDLKAEDGSPVRGSNAPLSGTGYFAIAKLKSKEEMKEFTRRLISSMGFAVNNEGMLGGLVEWYSGEKAVQNFDALRHEITMVQKTENSWIVNR